MPFHANFGRLQSVKLQTKFLSISSEISLFLAAATDEAAYMNLLQERFCYLHRDWLISYFSDNCYGSYFVFIQYSSSMTKKRSYYWLKKKHNGESRTCLTVSSGETRYTVTGILVDTIDTCSVVLAESCITIWYV